MSVLDSDFSKIHDVEEIELEDSETEKEILKTKLLKDVRETIIDFFAYTSIYGFEIEDFDELDEFDETSLSLDSETIYAYINFRESDENFLRLNIEASFYELPNNKIVELCMLVKDLVLVTGKPIVECWDPSKDEYGTSVEININFDFISKENCEINKELLKEYLLIALSDLEKIGTALKEFKKKYEKKIDFDKLFNLKN